MDEDIKKLLEGFADRTADGLPPADIDADVARGRRALRRIKRRRRVTGVLCVAAVSAAVLAIGNQVKWWNNGTSEVATGEAEKTAGPTPSPTANGETMSMFATGAAVELVANKQTWNTIGCSLAPKNWTPETPIAANRVVLTPPTVRTADTTAKLVIEAAPQARSLMSVRVTDSGGKAYHFGTLDGRTAAQVKLADRWLLVEVPAHSQDWNDDLLRRFLASCTVN
ncbi:hypothetical protein [Kribbella antiqua]|uniref:hypothetical protein n=1 Tax=Kribbella antiqua TaxID=2512217 RepID=UPI0013052610|nr:hypothetical protein [Kribbella antiqua]